MSYIHRTSNYIEIPSIDDRSKSLLYSNKTKIDNIENDIKKSEKNPDFYRNKKIIAIAIAVAAVAATALLAYFCWGLALPLLIGTIGTGHASGIAFAGALIAPILPAVAGFFGVSHLFRSLESDRKDLEKLQTESNKLKNRIQSQITHCDQNFELSKVAAAEEFSEEAWTAFKNISTPTSRSILGNIGTNEKQKAIWLSGQMEIISFGEKNKVAKQEMSTILANT